MHHLAIGMHRHLVCQIIRMFSIHCPLLHDVIALSSDKTILRFWKGHLQRTSIHSVKGVNRLQTSVTCPQKQCVRIVYKDLSRVKYHYVSPV